MTSVKGIYTNGQVTLAEPIPAAGPLEVVVVYDEKEADVIRLAALTFPDYDVTMPDSAERFDREMLY